jgi:arylamine N-acetyltransferase
VLEIAGAATDPGPARPEHPDTDVPGYLRRLRLEDVGPPSASALAAIRRAHVERIAYNTLDIHLGRRTMIDPYASAHRIASTGRGGYRFHLNGALAALLSALGYDVRWHRGGVWRRPADSPLTPFANHLVLTVHGLPTAESPDGVWLVDAGLGDALHEPAPLQVGELRQGPFGYGLERSPRLANGWRFRHDPAGSFAGMDFEIRRSSADEFVEAHEVLSTSPTSTFVQWILVQRRDATGVDKLVSCALRRTDGTRTTQRLLGSASEWFAALADVFLLTLDDVDADGKEWLWRRARVAQEAWERSQA